MLDDEDALTWLQAGRGLAFSFSVRNPLLILLQELATRRDAGNHTRHTRACVQ